MPTRRHFWNLQNGHRFLWVLSILHAWCSAQMYFLLFWTVLLKKPCECWRGRIHLKQALLLSSCLQHNNNCSGGHKNNISRKENPPCSFHRWADRSGTQRLDLHTLDTGPPNPHHVCTPLWKTDLEKAPPAVCSTQSSDSDKNTTLCCAQTRKEGLEYKEAAAAALQRHKLWSSLKPDQICSLQVYYNKSVMEVKLASDNEKRRRNAPG